MVNCNGTIQQEVTFSLASNRGFLFGDSVFETIRTLNNKVLFLEDHYFRLMASMRICRMEIPMQLTMEYFESQILELLMHAKTPANRVRFTVFRVGDGFYLPTSNEVAFLVTFQSLENELYLFNEADYEVDLFKDAYVTKQLLSSLKTNNKMIQITGSIFANENGYQNCLLLNDEKNVIEALQGNLFMKMGKQLITPPVADGCLNGIMRKQVLSLARKMENIEVLEKSISPFDLQKADELFITNVIKGVQPITKYRKKIYVNELSKEILMKLNAQIRLS
ncbi:MAG: aminotransferase class IV [Flavobacterium sp.]|jgi:branched-chain amino acid aminotransferase|nr:aminotransferase class IV [Flavobacterium sp.]